MENSLEVSPQDDPFQKPWDPDIEKESLIHPEMV